MNRKAEVEHLSKALSELIALRGLARVGGDSQLAAVWSEIAGEQIAGRTKVLGLKRGVLHIGVNSSALLGQLASFHKQSLLRQLKQQRELKIRDLKFELRGDLKVKDASPPPSADPSNKDND